MSGSDDDSERLKFFKGDPFADAIWSAEMTSVVRAQDSEGRSPDD